MSKVKLTQKQENFCLAYIETGDSSEAYRRAYNSKNMKPTTINRKAFDLINNGNVTARIAELRSKAEERTMITIERVVEEICHFALLDPGDILTEDGKLKNLNQMKESTRRAISEVTTRVEATMTDGQLNTADIVKIKFNDKKGGLDMLMKYLGAYEKDNEQSKQSVEIIVNADTIKKVITNFDDEY